MTEQIQNELQELKKQTLLEFCDENDNVKIIKQVDNVFATLKKKE